MPARHLKPRAKVDSKGRIIIHKLIREELDLKKGDVMEQEAYGKDKVLLTKLGGKA